MEHKQDFLNQTRETNQFEDQESEKKESVVKKSAKSAVGLFFVTFRLIPYILISVFFVLIIAIIFLALTIAPHYATIKSVYGHGLEAQVQFEKGGQYFQEQKFDLAGEEFAKAEESFSKARDSLKLLETSFLFNIQYLNDQLIVAKDILFIGQKTAESLQSITDFAGEIKSVFASEELNFSQIDIVKKKDVLALVMNSDERFRDLQISLDLVNTTLKDINRHQPLFIFDPIVDPLQQELPRVKRVMDSFMKVLKLLPALTGYPEEKTYLIIMQNNREMRASGGFIGTYGILKVANADLQEMFLDNSYNLDFPVKGILHVEPPEPIREYLRQEDWFFRDSNWWPDFPTSAEKMQWFYHEEGGEEELDGVIAITPNVIEDLLGLMGDFTVEDLTFTGENFWEQLEYQVEYGYYKQGIPESDRKDIIGTLGQMIIAKLYTTPLSDWSALIDLMQKQIEEKHMVFYFNDSEFQEYAHANEWTGEVKPYDGDYLMFIDSNMAALKTDAVMDRTATYKLVQNKNGEVEVELKIKYQNLGVFDWHTTRYRTYTRLYLPNGTELIEIKNGNKVYDTEDIDQYEEFGKQVYGIFFEVEPQTNRDIVWRYKLPTRISQQIEEGKYNLLVQKQIGLPKYNLQLDLEFNQDIKKSGLNGPKDSNKIFYTEVLKKDREYTVVFE